MEQIYAAFNREVHLFVRINTHYLKAWSTGGPQLPRRSGLANSESAERET
jgi:hypothetical protein